MRTNKIMMLLLLLISITSACKKDTVLPAINSLNSGSKPLTREEGLPVENFLVPENFVKDITNFYYPLATGDTLYYYVVEVDGDETIIQTSFVAVTPEIKLIQGISCKVIRDIVMQDGIVVEDTYDWYAQDIKGNVWYFGEDTKKLLPDGSWSTEGSWEFGVDGAIAGIIMAAVPEDHIGQKYRQEHYAGFAQDKAKILSTNETITIGLGTFTDCLLIEETTPLDPGVVIHKWYAPGIGELAKTGISGVIEDGELTGSN